MGKIKTGHKTSLQNLNIGLRICHAFHAVEGLSWQSLALSEI